MPIVCHKDRCLRLNAIVEVALLVHPWPQVSVQSLPSPSRPKVSRQVSIYLYKSFRKLEDQKDVIVKTTLRPPHHHKDLPSGTSFPLIAALMAQLWQT